MNKVVNTYWVDPRLAAQRPVPRVLAPDFKAPRVDSLSAARRREGLVPSWVIFGMIILAAFITCLTVTKRTHAERRAAEQQYQRIGAEVETLRNTNAALEREIKRMSTDPRAIEAAARERLGMVRANEIVVPVE